MEKEFVRARALRDVIVSLAMTVTGIVLIILPSAVSGNIFGTCLAVPGMLMLLFFKSGYVDPSSGHRFRRMIKYFPVSRKNEILNALRENPSKVDWNAPEASSGLMLDIYVGCDEDKVFVRMSEFVPYNYVPCSDWLAYEKAQVAGLIK